MNALFVRSISTNSDSAIQAIGQLLTGKVPTKPYMILGEDHPLREGVADFIMCPLNARKSAEMSTISSLGNEEERMFHKALQNMGRYEPAVDASGKPINLLAAAPYGTDRVTGESPLFNVFTAYMFVRVMTKIPRLDYMMEGITRDGDKHNLDKVFDIKVLNAKGHEVYLIGPEFVALMDFAVSTCIWAQLPLLAPHRPFYDRRVALYAALDGKDGRLDMRAELKAVLEEFFDSHPQHAKFVRRLQRKSAPTGDTIVDLTEEEINAFARPGARRSAAGTFLSHPQCGSQNQRLLDT